MKYMVECNYISGWDSAEWQRDDEPMYFDTEDQAKAEIDEFIKDMDRAYQQGDVSDKYNREDYRVVEVKDED